MNESGVQTESLPVMTDAKLKSAFGRISDKYTHDFYKDDTSWAPIQKMMKELKDILPTFSLVESFYDNEMPNKSKTWNFLGVFVTPAGVQRVVPAQIKAHGAGSVEDPLDRFDITFTYTPLSPMNVTDSKRIEMLKSLGVKTREASVSLALDKIADRLESLGMVKEAHDLDVVSNTIEAAGYQQDPQKGVSGPHSENIQTTISNLEKLLKAFPNESKEIQGMIAKLQQLSKLHDEQHVSTSSAQFTKSLQMIQNAATKAGAKIHKHNVTHPNDEGMEYFTIQFPNGIDVETSLLPHYSKRTMQSETTLGTGKALANTIRFGPIKRGGKYFDYKGLDRLDHIPDDSFEILQDVMQVTTINIFNPGRIVEFIDVISKIPKDIVDKMEVSN